MIVSRFPRLMGAACALAVLAGCAKQDLKDPPVDLGPFKLGLNIVVADNMQKVPISRDATVDEWETGLKNAVAARFGRYTGDRFYNIGINVDGYALAPPGIPVVAAPKSVVVVTANIWDDGTATRLNPEPKQFTIFENLSGGSIVGSGYTSTKQEQLDALSYNVANAIEGWFLQNPQWFDPAGARAGPAPASANADPAPTVVSAGGATEPAPAPVVAATPEISATPLPPPAVLLEAVPTGAAPAAQIRPQRRPGG